MKKEKNKNLKLGFTLLELLVVVLIIGILAGIALPQYRLAVNKSHAIRAVNMLKKITDAQEIFYLTNGQYTNNITELDIEIPEYLKGVIGTESDNPNQYMFACANKQSCIAWAENLVLPNFMFVMKYAPGNTPWTRLLIGKHFCMLIDNDKTKNEIAKKICASLGKEDKELPKLNSSVVGKYFRMN